LGNDQKDNSYYERENQHGNPIPPPEGALDRGMRTDLDEISSAYPVSKRVPPKQDSWMRAIHPVLPEDDQEITSELIGVELEKPPPEAMQGAPSFSDDKIDPAYLGSQGDQWISRWQDEGGSIFQKLGDLIRQIMAIILGDKNKR